MFHSSRLVLVLVMACVGVSACRDEPPPPRDELPPPPLPEPKAAEAKKGKEPITGDGMLCWSRDSYLWKPDGSTQALPGYAIRMAQDGTPYIQMFGKESGLALLSKPEERRFMAASGERLMVVADDVAVVEPEKETSTLVMRKVDKDTSLSLPDGVAVDRHDLLGMALMNKELWIATKKGLFRRVGDATALERIAIAADDTMLIGFAARGDEAIVISSHDYREQKIWKLDATGKATELKTIEATGSMSSQPQIARLSASGWIAYGARSSITSSAISVVSPDGEVEEIENSKLLTIDDQDRVWYVQRGNAFAREADGTTTSFPAANTQALVGVDDTLARCEPLGNGFAKLPEAQATIKGTLKLTVAGSKAKGARFIACDNPLLGSTPCGTTDRKVEGTLSDAGAWSGEVPIGDYSLALEIDGKWVTAVLDGRAKTNCKIEEGKACELKATTD